ncbi:uncharacterized protein BXZ73DRAFT_104474 [Epithele typhae]|uniref:uncharacterized protein n=1 Tax=Epithele typhae TaxID=378194 RepID=UPI002007796A|nr:uncharacterized protein BXZ73DRAFT_104474 [Epithele typhae]KAH9921187.1 hypothetical protein BXZ73DRAFT_104474 [Epithele typhae]
MDNTHPLRLFQGDFNNDHGTFQQFCLVPAEIAAKIPEGISFEQAATIPLGLGTAFCGLTPGPPFFWELF